MGTRIPYVHDGIDELVDTDTTNSIRDMQLPSAGLDSTNQFLQRINAHWDTRWRDFGLLWMYVAFNVAGAMVLYWFFRVPKGKKARN
ncbi:uncharacterized protein M421DRAFT_3016 [Didymella exigua CBS 183.55]|uniref:CDR ABC transporter domain-containing protein n=1 Tax=Didymella exigua CBS 183.55 TaxID=1150837 RepID=A0A6A5RTI8_9PLEO|nr:uncharacterized protein M421DRAFT_3016 [Didymella exigua CBS 183.55]KAF1930710.1 hypothetical protein M421DRAFT_3016 [Didymella exigua CBS 183.55]